MIDRSWKGREQFAARIRTCYQHAAVFYLSGVSTSQDLFRSVDIIRKIMSMGMKQAESYGLGEKYM
jgi:hypothetical protein